MADVNAAMQRHIGKKLTAMVAERELMAKSDVTEVAQAAGGDTRCRLREFERHLEELTRRQQRAAAAVDDVRGDLRALSTSKLERIDADPATSAATTTDSYCATLL